MARLAKAAFDGKDLRPKWRELIGKLLDGTASAGEGLDLGLIAQLLGDKPAGLAIQHDVLRSHQLFGTRCHVPEPRLKLLALAAETDLGSNTPIEFLLEESAVELTTLYLLPGAELLDPLPDHDLAIVIASDSEDCRAALRTIEAVATRWPRPLLNPPKLIGNLDRDKLHRLLQGIDGLAIPATFAVGRERLLQASPSADAFDGIAPGLAFPVIIRPRGSHAGVGLAKVDDRQAMVRYLAERPEAEFFVSRFVDYSGEDGQFRKYRVAFIEGRPYAGHMAIADRWDIWYLNAHMSASASKRLEEETFMRTFDIGFGRRHRSALDALAQRIGLEYFTIDCAETRDGALLIFEADNTAVVHNMDPPDVFPYKGPQMRRIFDAFVAMLARRVRERGEEAA
ncbi:ATP-grasp domain-containing protein [Bradyrhizobium sp.]|uniref:ATP-grasp domain-containing protein n=1 Tax=Bradyrhizobium sp. TaxID=376 RepID=UPI0025C3D795|nr:hypothetical protein [Bradyrhizobium sp.]MBV8922892.1 hypothetical protein [Bradyrhizobium sp.]